MSSNYAIENGRADKQRAYGKRPWRRAAASAGARLSFRPLGELMHICLPRLAVALALVAVAWAADAADLKVYSTTALTEIWHDLKPKFEARGHKLGRGIPNAEFVVKGESDIAIQQIPELMVTAGVDIVGPFPPALLKSRGFDVKP